MGIMYNDEILGISCILSENRMTRPNHFKKASSCPFCPENDGDIEIEICSHTTTEGDRIRIVNNKYPACSTHDGVYGIHDVIIETDQHNKKPWDFSKSHWEELFKVIQDRWIELSKDPRIHFIQVFKNEGVQAGASINHPHAQIIALEEIPYTMDSHYKKVEMYYKETGKCRICEEMNKNIILENEGWMLNIPEGLCFPYETWLVPKVHTSHLGELTPESIKYLGDLMHQVMELYHEMLKDVSYNLCFMSSPPNKEGSYHFFIKILPRTGEFAGFELATGCMINVGGPSTLRQLMEKTLGNMKGDYKSNE
nr:DUF4931 domain-containing protein [uncultured Niameybacter sp.]